MKPFTSKHMFGADLSPLKQTKPKKNVDSPETKALKAKLGAEKDAANQAYRQRLLSMDYNEATGKGGYTKSQTDLYNKVANKGSYDGFGASVNFRTGQTRITDYPEKYVPAKNKNGSSDRIFSKDGKKLIASSSTQDYGKRDYYGGSDYKNPKNDKKMGHQQFRESFIKDSISGQGAKEKHVIWAENAKRVSDLYGNQTSKANAGEKKVVKKTTAKKTTVKKPPLLQTQPAKKTIGSTAGTRDSIRREMIKNGPTKKQQSLPPGTKIDGDMSKLDKYGRTPQEAKIHEERLGNMTSANKENLRKGMQQPNPKSRRDSLNKQVEAEHQARLDKLRKDKNKPQPMSTKLPFKMKKC